MTEKITITNDELPALYRAADKASLDAQNHCLKLFRAELGFIIIASISTSLSVDSTDCKKLLAGIAAGAIILSLSATVISILWKQDKKWYGGRALAESIKSLTWRFVTGSEPYLSSLSQQDVESNFSKTLLEMLEQVRDVDTFTTENFGDEKQITERMRAVRQKTIEVRLAIYVENRVREQRAWYSDKARINKTSSNNMFTAIIVIQLAAVLAAIGLIYVPNFPVNLGSILVTVATTLIAWLQMKKHQELSQSYSIAAHELGFIEEQANHIINEHDFSVFVADAENAISREHTLWAARRDVFTYSKT